MKKSKLLDLIKTFSPVECRQFTEFISSPYFNKNEELLPFWLYLEKYYPEFPDEWVLKEVVFKHIYPSEAFDAKKMGYLMNYLLKLGEDFLSMQQYRKNELKNRYYLLEEFEKRKLPKHFQFTHKKTEQYLKSGIKEDSDYLLYKYKISEIYSDFQMKAKNESYLQDASQNLDEYYFLLKLRQGCEMINRNRQYTSKINLSFIDEIDRMLQLRDNWPAIVLLYSKIFSILKSNENEIDFSELLELLKIHGDEIDINELKHIYFLALNISIRKFREGNPDYIETSLVLYEEGIDSKALFENGFLTSNTYTNTIRLAILSKKYERAKNFIKDNTKFLEKEKQKDAYHFNLALLAFEQKEYKETLIHLYKMPFSETFYDLANKVLMVKTYYELDEIDPLLSLIASFTIYLKRNKKLNNSIREPHLNFCSLINQIMRRNYKKKDKLLEKIQAAHPVIEKGWLIKAWEEQFS